MSDRLIFTGTPTIKLKTFDGEIFTLYGVSLATSSETSGMVIGSVVVPISELQAKAQFSITDDQIKLLNKGISKVRISTAPITHERTFSQDVIGKRLFKQFESVKKKQTNSNPLRYIVLETTNENNIITSKLLCISTNLKT